MPDKKPRYRVELLCDDGDWLIVAQNLTRLEADRRIESAINPNSRYRIVRDG